MACIEICRYRIQKIHEEVTERYEIINKKNATCKSHTNITFLKKVVFLEERLSPRRENFLEGMFPKELNIYYSPNIPIVE